MENLRVEVYKASRPQLLISVIFIPLDIDFYLTVLNFKSRKGCRRKPVY